MSDFRSKLPHFLLKGNAKSERYVSPGSQFPRPRYPERNRLEHAEHLLFQINAAYNEKLVERKLIPQGVATPDGIFLELEGSLGFDLDLAKLDLPSQKIELLNVKKQAIESGEKITATLFIPDEKIVIFIKKIKAYRDQETKSGKPRHDKLISGIDNIKLAVLRSLWTDLEDLFPAPEEFIWWELWLRATPTVITEFRNFAHLKNINVSRDHQEFPDRYVILAHTTASILSELIDSLTIIAEVRKAKETTKDFLEMSNYEQKQWMDSFLGLIDVPGNQDMPIVCILDTGANSDTKCNLIVQ